MIVWSTKQGKNNPFRKKRAKEEKEKKKKKENPKRCIRMESAQSKKLQKIRALFDKYQIDGYIIPHNDAHNVRQSRCPPSIKMFLLFGIAFILSSLSPSC